jgi:hypothetical protein
MGLVSFLRSPVLGTFGLKREKNVFRRVPILTFFQVNNSGGQKMGLKRQIFTCQMDFALISTVFICLGSYFTRSTTMRTQKFHMILTNVQKCIGKTLFTRQTESSFLSKNIYLFTSRKKKYLSRHFRIQIVETSATSVWQLKIRRCMPIFYPLN